MPYVDALKANLKRVSDAVHAKTAPQWAREELAELCRCSVLYKFTCFPSTKVQILTTERRRTYAGRLHTQNDALSQAIKALSVALRFSVCLLY